MFFYNNKQFAATDSYYCNNIILINSIIVQLNSKLRLLVNVSWTSGSPTENSCSEYHCVCKFLHVFLPNVEKICFWSIDLGELLHFSVLVISKVFLTYSFPENNVLGGFLSFEEITFESIVFVHSTP